MSHSGNMIGTLRFLVQYMYVLNTDPTRSVRNSDEGLLMCAYTKHIDSLQIQDSLVSIATGCGLDGLGFESWWE